MQVGTEHFKQWIAQHHEVLYRHARWMTGNNDLAKDLVQDTYFQAWKYRSSLREENKVLGWLLTILRRLVYKECRQNMSRSEFLQEFAQDAVATERENIDAMIDLERNLNLLNASQREILLLYALHGFTYEEISEQLEIPLGTVMSRISRARKSMQAKLLDTTQQDPNNTNVIDINERIRQAGNDKS